MESWTIDLLEKKKIILKVLYYTHTQKCLHKDTKNNLLFWCYSAFAFLDFFYLLNHILHLIIAIIVGLHMH